MLHSALPLLPHRLQLADQVLHLCIKECLEPEQLAAKMGQCCEWVSLGAEGGDYAGKQDEAVRHGCCGCGGSEAWLLWLWRLLGECKQRAAGPLCLLQSLCACLPFSP